MFFPITLQRTEKKGDKKIYLQKQVEAFPDKLWRVYVTYWDETLIKMIWNRAQGVMLSACVYLVSIIEMHVLRMWLIFKLETLSLHLHTLLLPSWKSFYCTGCTYFK